ncbi:MAG: hypothetical protein GX779_05415 [Clostridia bacterium]|nr:hypothetical protein [Clostridia bacterium]
MYRIKKLLNLPVISLSNGEQQGVVLDVVIDPEQRSLAALVLDYRKGFFKEPRLIPYEDIESIGEHAVTIRDPKDCKRAVNLPQLAPFLKRPVQLLDAKVITQDGTLLGTVEEYSFHAPSGQITDLEISGSFLSDLFHGRAFLPGEAISTIGRNTVIVQAGAQKLLKREETGLSGTARTVKETSQKVWSSTVETTKKLGESLYKSVEKITANEEEEKSPASAQKQAPEKLVLTGVESPSSVEKEKT